MILFVNKKNMSDFKIIGNPDPVVGKEEFYSVNHYFTDDNSFLNPISQQNTFFGTPIK